MPTPLVVITDCDLPGTAAEEALTAAGMIVRRASCARAEDVVDAAKGADALIVQWAPVTAAVFGELDSLSFISRLGIGYDMIDVESATRHGVAVANTPTYCVEEVAAHTVAMGLSLTRGLSAYDRAVREGRWAPTQPRPMAARPSATTVAVVGFGRIGSLAARHFEALGFRVVVHDPFVPESVSGSSALEFVPLESALDRADILTLHAPLTESTRHLIDAEALAAMKPGAVLVNTCRGGLVDEAALVDALGAGRLAGAALDVFDAEPLAADHPLCSLDNVILTPHAAWYSPEAMVDLPVHAANNVVEFLAGRPVPSVVNPDYLTASIPAPGPAQEPVR
jgi:D-3-phosphoglycerate dehydrogenase